jgi:hypothetical protein
LDLPPEFIGFCFCKHIRTIARYAQQAFGRLMIAFCLLRATLVLGIIINGCCLEIAGWF